MQTVRGTRVGVASRCARQKRGGEDERESGEAGTRLHVGARACKGENTNMMLFAIIGENLGVYESATVTSATIIGMLIVCWAIYTVYTDGFSDL